MTGSSRPVVCVVIPTLNESGTIGALIESLEGLAGLYDVGIVVVDDGSTDGTVEIESFFSNTSGRLTPMRWFLPFIGMDAVQGETFKEGPSS